MARLVLFLSKLSLIAYLFACGVLVLFLSLKTEPCNINVPPNYHNASDTGIHMHNGIIFLHNNTFSGFLYALYPNRDTAFCFAYVDGKEQGVQRKWYPGKQLAEERTYTFGKKTGIHRAWWENGKLKFEYHFDCDEFNGEVREWFINGKLFRVFHYVKGYEDGLQQMWWENGKLRANYVVKNGEQFGLIGRKICKNPDDEK